MVSRLRSGSSVCGCFPSYARPSVRLGSACPRARKVPHTSRRGQSSTWTTITARRSPTPTAGSRTRPRPRRPPGSRRKTPSRSRTSSASRIAQQLLDRVMQLNDYERYSAPSRKGEYFFFSQERGLAEPERVVHPKGPRRRARGADRSERVVGGWDRAAQCVRAVEGREARGLRDLAQRLGLAAIQSHGARDETDAARHGRLGEGVERRVARRRVLLQPLSRAARRAREGVDQREPSGVLPQARHASRRRTRSSTRIRRICSASTCSTRPRTNASRSSRCPSAATARTATRCSCAISRSRAARSRRSSRRSRTTRST